MSSEGKNASDRLKQLFAVGPELANHIETTICNTELRFGRQTKLSDLDWTSPENHYLMDYIEKAFEDASLDIGVPWHWRLLLYFFARAHYLKTKPKKWTGTSYVRLLQAEAAIRAKYPSLSQAQVHTKLARMPRYRKIGSEQLRKMLRHAKDPKKNAILNVIVLSALEPLRELGEKHKVLDLEQTLSILKPVFVKHVLKMMRKSPALPS
jgi:hypothetical protein